jgi:hypothetical protein
MKVSAILPYVLFLVLADRASASRSPTERPRVAARRSFRSSGENSTSAHLGLVTQTRLAAARANRQAGTDFRDPCSGLALTQEDWEPFINERSPDPFPKPYNVQPMHYATGYFHIGCTLDTQRDQIRWYHDNVPKLDRLGMTPMNVSASVATYPVPSSSASRAATSAIAHPSPATPTRVGMACATCRALATVRCLAAARR